jgi:predicted DNA-binding transcriptional regulator YafY
VRLRVTHQGFSKSEAKSFTIAPYGLKVFKQRWYVLAASEYPDGRLLVYSLDRFTEVERTDISYTIPADFDVNEHFRSFYGVSSLSNAQPEIVQLRIDASQVKFFRTLPLHHSQEEIETTDAYSVFQYYLVPTFELAKELLSNGPFIEVLLPLSLREEIMDKVKIMRKIYK